MGFLAKYAGECDSCGEAIRPDDLIEEDEDMDGYRHSNCPPPPPPKVVCSRCWTTKPCGCDDDG
jgi:hypothetical protein